MAHSPKPKGRTRLPQRLTNGTNKCASCHKSGATSCCADCRSLDIGAISTWYCNQTCQNKHWPKHKIACRERRRLFRAVRLLAAFWDIFTTHTFSKPIAYRSHDEAGCVHVTYNSDVVNAGSWTGESIFRDFPKGVVPDDVDETIRQAVLHHGSSQESMIFGAGFVETIISRTCIYSPIAVCNSNIQLAVCYRIQESRLNPSRRALVFKYIDKAVGSDTSTAITPTTPNHSFFRIDLATGGSFAIDLTGSQFGWRETVYRWSHCMHRAKNKDVKFWPFGGHRKLDMLALSNLQPYEPKRAVAELRVQIAQSMCNDLRDFLFDKKMMNIRVFLSQANEGYAARQDELLAFIKTKVGERLHDLTVRKGIGRMYFCPDKDGGHTRVVRKEDTLKPMESVWFTQEEVEAKNCDKDALSAEWIDRAIRANRERISAKMQEETSVGDK